VCQTSYFFLLFLGGFYFCHASTNAREFNLMSKSLENR
jgi:hypothetical protein